MRWIWIAFWTIATLLLLATFVVAKTVYAIEAPVTSTRFFEATKAFILCLGGASVILSTFFTAVNAFVQRRSDTIRNTFELLTSWDDPHLFQARKLTRRAKASRGDTSDNQLIEEIEKNEDLKNSVILVLNYFEHVRFSLEVGRVDKKLFTKSLGPVVIDIVDRFMPFARKQGAHVAADLDNLKKILT